MSDQLLERSVTDTHVQTGMNVGQSWGRHCLAFADTNGYPNPGSKMPHQQSLSVRDFLPVPTDQMRRQKDGVTWAPFEKH